MSTRIRIMLLLLLTLLTVFVFSSCNNNQKENADIQTTLTVEGTADAVSGTRTIVMTLPHSIVSPGSEASANLDKVVDKYLPSCLKRVRDETDGKIRYTFTLSFDSLRDYIEDVSELLGEPAIIVISHPESVMTQGWKIEESFESKDLIMGWLQEGAKSEGFSGLDFSTQETSTSLSLGGESYTTEPRILHNSLKGNPIQNIRIETVKSSKSGNKEKISFERTVYFTIAQSTYDADPKDIENYFKDRTRKAKVSSWSLRDEDKSYVFTAKYTNFDASQLRSNTSELLNSDYGELVYQTEDEGSTVLAEQNSFMEYLDFSHYINSEGGSVPVEYIYQVTDPTDLSDCQVYENGEWKTASADHRTSDYQYTKKCAVRYNTPTLKVRINDGIQYKASAIEIEAVPQDNDELQKTITFRFDSNGESLDQAAAEHARLFIDRQGYGARSLTENGKSFCTFTTSGPAETLNEIFAKILSGKNTMRMSSEGQFLSLRTMKHYSERMDLSALLVGENSEVKVLYQLKSRDGDIIKSFRFRSGDENEEADVKSTNAPILNLRGGDITIEYDVTTPNISDIIFCSVISAILVMIAIAAILLLRKKPLPRTALGSGHTGQNLPGGKNKMIVSSQKKSITKK